MSELIELNLEGIRLEVPSNYPVLVLQEMSGAHRILPIYIGTPEASAIHYSLQGLTPDRPLTHDLIVDTIAALSASISSLVISKIVAGTYFAELHLQRGKSQFVVSCRPSDGVAIAVRANTKIYASSELLDQVGREPTSGDEEEIIDEFHEFIESLNPDDFKS